MDFDPERRRVLAMGVATGALLAAQAAAPTLAMGKAGPMTLEQCQNLSPKDLAERSSHVQKGWDYIKNTSSSIKDPGLRAKVGDILANPAPTLLNRLADPKDRQEVFNELSAKGYIQEVTVEDFLPPAKDPNQTIQPFLSAPGSGYQSHHAYPGGLVTHTTANLKISLAIHGAYHDVYGSSLDRDVVVAAQTLHDLHKPWVFAWQPDLSCRPEKTMAGTGEHHPLSVAESIHRGLPAQVVTAQACAHNHPGQPKDEAEVVGWIKAAAIIAGVDPVKYGLLAQDGQTLPLPRRMEGFVTHLGDHDYVLTVPQAKWTIAVLGNLAKSRYGLSDEDLKGAKFNALRNAVFSQATIEALYHTYSTQGPEALARVAEGLVKPV